MDSEINEITSLFMKSLKAIYSVAALKERRKEGGREAGREEGRF
jgi:hypothetical protein